MSRLRLLASVNPSVSKVAMFVCRLPEDTQLAVDWAVMYGNRMLCPCQCQDIGSSKCHSGNLWLPWTWTTSKTCGQRAVLQCSGVWACSKTCKNPGFRWTACFRVARFELSRGPENHCRGSPLETRWYPGIGLPWIVIVTCKSFCCSFQGSASHPCS
jgi:hypothetical protein